MVMVVVGISVVKPVRKVCLGMGVLAPAQQLQERELAETSHHLMVEQVIVHRIIHALVLMQLIPKELPLPLPIVDPTHPAPVRNGSPS